MSWTRSLGQWAEDLKRNVDLEVGQRVKDIARDAKHYALREVGFRKYFAEHPIPKIHLGTGANLMDGWLNVDLMPHSRATMFMDVTRAFPFRDDSFDYAFSEHVIEHVPYLDGKHMLREAFRVLKPGAPIRVVTPDLAALIDMYGREKTEVEEKYIRFITDRFIEGVDVYRDIFVINTCVRFSGHQFIYDGPTLEEAMLEAGFVDVVRCETGKSEVAEFDGLDSHGDYIEDEEINAFESMVYEGRKPGTARARPSEGPPDGRERRGA